MPRSLTQVLMPQLGESIAEGTIVRWMKQAGDAVGRDEPLFEISTDKVDAEIPSPASGVLTDIRVPAGETVPVDSVVATIAAAQDGGVLGGDAPVEDAPAAAAARSSPAARSLPAARSSPAPRQTPTPPASGSASASADGARPSRVSPLVRRLAREHGVDVGDVAGTGSDGRVTRDDILRHVEAAASAAAGVEGEAGGVASSAAGVEGEAGNAASSAAGVEGEAGGAASAAGVEGEAGARVEPMSVLRRQIADHMVRSRRTSAHVHTLFDVDFSRVARLRAEHGEAWAAAGVRLTYLAFVARAAAAALAEEPLLNAAVSDDGRRVVYRRDVNLGIAVALDEGLIVPVIRQANRQGLAGLSRAIDDAAARARAGALAPSDVSGGTFTITNPGSFGSVLGLPIINQPQVAILCVGAVEQRPAVVDDAGTIRARTRCYLTLGFDHRLIDGAVADRFMARVKAGIESFDADLVALA